MSRPLRRVVPGAACEGNPRRPRQGEEASRSDCRGGGNGLQLTLFPLAPDDADEVPLERADRFSAGLPLADPAGEVGLRGRRAAALRQRDAIEDRVQLAVSAPVQAVTHPLGRRRLQWGYPGVGRELGVGSEAVPWAEDGGERPGGQQADAADLRQRREAWRRQRADLGGEGLDLREGQAKTLRQTADWSEPFLPDQ